MGYSYGDINLKQITKWIQNNSKVMPPMFLVVSKENKNQSKYLENFGIKTIIIQAENVSFGLDSYSNKLIMITVAIAIAPIISMIGDTSSFVLTAFILSAKNFLLCL